MWARQLCGSLRTVQEAWRAAAVTRNFSVQAGGGARQQKVAASPTPPEGGIYELRTYTVYPDKMKEFLSITEQQFAPRLAHSPVVGYWTAEVGGLNQVVHIWHYDSLSQRAGVRRRLAGDAEWLSGYVARVIGMWQQQDNDALTLLPGTSLTSPAQKGVYELQTLQLNGPAKAWLGPLVRYVGAGGEAGVAGGSSLVGAWRSFLGRGNMAVLLWHHLDPDACLALSLASQDLQQSAELSPHIASSHNKLLLPHAVSPLQ